ncbi:hypothetical protein [Helicobacter mustelae]|nr:hypothetical protein [Helicobacter mustelae]
MKEEGPAVLVGFPGLLYRSGKEHVSIYLYGCELRYAEGEEQ